jgi:hypothetical protein
MIGTSTRESVSWETESATAVEIALDTATPAPFGPNVSTEPAVPCDGAETEEVSSG